MSIMLNPIFVAIVAAVSAKLLPLPFPPPPAELTLLGLLPFELRLYYLFFLLEFPYELIYSHLIMLILFF